MTAAESRLTCELTWQAWDRLLHILLYGSVDQLSNFVVDVAEVRRRVFEMHVCASDAILVYLNPNVGKTVVPICIQSLANLRRKAKQQQKAGRPG
eukprot:10075379-Karenia_brevis.AAC.1